MISERNSEIRSPFAKFRQGFAQLFVVVRNRDATLRASVQDLKVQAAGVAQEFGVGGMFGDAPFRSSGLAEQVAAGKRHELQIVLAEQVAHCRGTAELRDAVGAQLYAVETDGSDVFNRLAIVASPSDGGVAEMNLGGRWSDGSVEVRQVHGRIKHVARVQHTKRHG